jgi:hypothetical protein
MRSNADKHFYIFPWNKGPIQYEFYTLTSMASYYLLFNWLLPLDLTVNIILCKLIYTIYIEIDAFMVNE